MARDLYEKYPAARLTIDAADSVLGFSLSQLMFGGPEAELTDTVNAQPALLAHSIAALAALQEVTGNALHAASLVAGHSMGEYSALVASGALDYTDGIKLVRARGDAMKRAGVERPGAMAAILGVDDTKIQEICETVGGVQVANYNAPGQIVISGEKEAIERAVEGAKKAGAKRAIVLAVSIAAHSELMRSAIEDFRAAVMLTPLHAPRIPVVSNVSARPLDNVEAIREELLLQLTHPVQWVKSIEWMESSGVTEFIELGAKDVLAGLNKRITRGAVTKPIGTVEQIEKFLAGASA
jgi:[acyl-carrier-protein] S-malonyltransferase